MKYNNFHAEKDTGHRCRWRIINHTKYLTRDWVANLSTLAHCKRLSAFAAAAAREKRNSPRSRVKLICRLYQSCNNNCNVLHTRPYYAAVGTFNGPWARFENRERRCVTPITTPFSSVFNWKIIPVEISKWKNFRGKTAQATPVGSQSSSINCDRKFCNTFSWWRCCAEGSLWNIPTKRDIRRRTTIRLN